MVSFRPPWRTAPQHRLLAKRARIDQGRKSGENGGESGSVLPPWPPEARTLAADPRAPNQDFPNATLVVPGNSHLIPIDSRVGSSATTTGVMEMLRAACQLSFTSIVGGNGSFISRYHSGVTLLDEIEAKSGASLGPCSVGFSDREPRTT